MLAPFFRRAMLVGVGGRVEAWLPKSKAQAWLAHSKAFGLVEVYQTDTMIGTLMKNIRAILVLVLLLVLPLEARAQETDCFRVVQRYIRTMIEQGRDVYGPQKSGLFLSALDRRSMQPLTARPAPPAGIRREDRPGRPWSAMNGANPQLDQNLLRLCYVLSEATGDATYARAADEALAWFLNHTQSPATGLLPWGEHLAWDVVLDQPISGGTDAEHEFARPWVLWDRCFALAPEASERFARGLWEHQIADQKTGAFDRHAPYFRHGPRDGKDFPRHGAFYIGTWGCAWKHTRDETCLRAIEAVLARFERKRVLPDGSRIGTLGPLDLDMAARNVPEPLAARLRAFAAAEDELIAPEMQKQAASGALPKWRNAYGAGTLASQAMFCVGRLEQVDAPAYRAILLAIADAYLGSRPEEDLDAWPLSFAHAISAELAAWRLTKEPKYLEQARRFSQMAVDLFWQDGPLPRASLHTDHYETITGADSLALALLEMDAALRGSKLAVPSNTVDR